MPLILQKDYFWSGFCKIYASGWAPSLQRWASELPTQQPTWNAEPPAAQLTARVTPAPAYSAAHSVPPARLWGTSFLPSLLEITLRCFTPNLLTLQVSHLR